jgi:hypothetical protein
MSRIVIIVLNSNICFIKLKLEKGLDEICAKFRLVRYVKFGNNGAFRDTFTNQDFN